MRVAALVSGGVDSSVSLRILKDAGYEVDAFYLKIWLEDELNYLSSCPWQEDLDYLRQVCKASDVKLQVVPMQREYFTRVVEHTVAEVKNGRTPNPDVWCNNRIKFGLFLEQFPDYEKVATGHYAQVTFIGDSLCLKQAPDPVKDQTYFLAHLSKTLLSRVMFPIGHLPKSEVRRLALDYALANATRKDSQGICFLGKFKFKDFLRHYLGTKEGQVIEFETGTSVGNHEGHWFYTKGQRKGIGLSGGPWYVVGKDIQTNVVFVSRHYFEEHLDRRTFKVENLNWFCPPAPDDLLQIKLRHGPNFNQGKIDLDTNMVTLEQNDQGIASGQLAVFYKDTYCLGAGTIA